MTDREVKHSIETRKEVGKSEGRLMRGRRHGKVRFEGSEAYMHEVSAVGAKDPASQLALQTKHYHHFFYDNQTSDGNLPMMHRNAAWCLRY
jgi:hypothetical protein